MADTGLPDRFKAATDGLLFMSESDYPFEVSIHEEPVVIPDALLADAGLPPETQVEKMSVDEFFSSAAREYEGQSDEARALAARYLELVSLIKQSLADSAVFKLGTINMPVYIVGSEPGGGSIWLKTRVVET
jgi:hypothetical protein